MTQRTGTRNALKREILVTAEQRCAAPPEVVWDLLADVGSHLTWGGERQSKKTRLLSISGPEGPAQVGTEFESTGADPMGGFADRSVVTEASRPGLFEFVTDARLTTKGKIADWTNVHRYEVSPDGTGSRIAYSVRITRISALPGMLAVFNIPVLSGLAVKASAGVGKRGLANLARLAEERSGA